MRNLSTPGNELPEIRFPGVPNATAWLNPPSRLALRQDGTIQVTTAQETDFWQRTHYGFQADNGHFLHTTVTGDFTFSCRVVYEPTSQYEQAGLMVRYDANSWIKASVEAETDGPFRLGAVVTRDGYSDWSTQSIPQGRVDRWFRIDRAGNDFTLLTHDGTGGWTQIRIAHLAPPSAMDAMPIAVGVYCASPKSDNLLVQFSEITLST
jgi:regulation of enolase protein 1 (concanavalin A-like superfamily)